MINLKTLIQQSSVNKNFLATHDIKCTLIVKDSAKSTSFSTARFHMPVVITLV